MLDPEHLQALAHFLFVHKLFPEFRFTIMPIWLRQGGLPQVRHNPPNCINIALRKIGRICFYDNRAGPRIVAESALGFGRLKETA